MDRTPPSSPGKEKLFRHFETVRMYDMYSTTKNNAGPNLEAPPAYLLFHGRLTL